MIPLYGFLEGDTIGLLVLAGARRHRSGRSRASCRRRPRLRVAPRRAGCDVYTAARRVLDPQTHRRRQRG